MSRINSLRAMKSAAFHLFLTTRVNRQ
ncbi:hypothetical protein RHECNPAF_3340062 [Rhizobium etli CNPAF512]|nr:hypothetical protein RHECNPAF_3340062 [Rhizobium etli CNPAF512]